MNNDTPKHDKHDDKHDERLQQHDRPGPDKPGQDKPGHDRARAEGAQLDGDTPEITPLAATLNGTTLASAVTVTDDRIRLSSGANIVKGQMAYCDKEAFLLIDLASPLDTTVWLVARGYSGTPALAHNVGANVKTGPQHYFALYNPAGAANAANVAALPWINVLTGDAFDVNAGAWRQVGINGVAQGTQVWP